MNPLLSLDAVDSVSAETSTPSAGAEHTENNEHDASRSSSPHDGIEDSSPHGDGVTPVKSPANERLEQLLAGKQPDGDDSPSSTQAADEESPAGPSAKTDEPDGGPAKPKPAEALSQEQEQVFNKAFSERPEWSAAIKIATKAGPEAVKEMRQQLRAIFQRETAVVSQVERLKPAAQLTDRIRRCTGDEGLENSVKLIEGWYEGRPETRKMLVDLLNDFDARTGAVITSPDLTKRLETAKAQMQDGLMDQEQFNQVEADLLERERERAESRQLKSQVQQRNQQETTQQQAARIQQETEALNAWEKKASKDPDYKVIQRAVVDRAYRMLAEKRDELQRDLTTAEKIGLAEAALKEVKAETAALRPRPRSMAPVPEGDGSSADYSEKEPSDPAKALLWRRSRGRR